jgi:uncharacterized membrane protein SpoIIM required for sporulation
MKQRQFEAQQESTWRDFEAMLGGARPAPGAPSRPPAADRPPAPTSTSTSTSTPASATGQDFVRLYRLVCRDLALAESRGYSPRLVERLNDLAMRGHSRLYTRRTGFLAALRAFVLRDFARLVRAEWRLVAIAAALFLLPGAIIILAIIAEPGAVYFVLSPAQAREYEAMYAPGQAVVGAARDAGDDFSMFGFYIANNIGVGFQCFATGVAFGLGPVFYLVFNSLMIGAVAGHLGVNGYGVTFYPFVIGHGAFELTAIVFAGAAGLKLGMALLRPGRRSRRDALAHHGRVAVRIMFGVFLMLLVAAFLEAFWSARTLVPAWTRLGVGAVLWLLVLAYFVGVGRTRAPMALESDDGGRH